MKKSAKKLAVITARGGSKRIPRKNIKHFVGSPIIKYSIDACLESNLFDEVMVSTDDLEIAEISKSFGAKVPFLRSEKTANDYATTMDVLREVLAEYQKMGQTFESMCCAYPCAPFLTTKMIKSGYEVFLEKEADILIPIVSFSYPMQRSFRIANGFLEYVYPEFVHSRSQDLEKRYHDVGMFYFYNVKNMFFNATEKAIKVVPFELPESQIQDIDSQEDWKMAEIKYKILKEME